MRFATSAGFCIATLVLTPCPAAVLTTLHSFAGGPSDGATPVSAVVTHGGALIGTTQSGGVGCAPVGCGVVFSLTPPTFSGGPWTETILHSFTGVDGDGSFPNSVVKGADGVLYGTTWGGGIVSASCPSGCGTVFSLAPPASAGGSWTETVVYSFSGTPDGSFPYTGVVAGGDGVLYGATFFGGTIDSSCAAGCGTIFALTPPASPSGAWGESLLHSFTGSASDGRGAVGVVAGSNGILYGATEYGGTLESGTVFKVTPPSQTGTWKETVIHNFGSYGDGLYPQANLTVGKSGELYGTTLQGGTGRNGTVFSMSGPESPGGPWTETVICSFPGGNSPSSPDAPVVIGSGGALYGTTNWGGNDGEGTVYALLPPSSSGGPWTEFTLVSFAVSNGADSFSGLTFGPQGVLYGATSLGGTSNMGTVFSLQP